MGNQDFLLSSCHAERLNYCQRMQLLRFEQGADKAEELLVLAEFEAAAAAAQELLQDTTYTADSTAVRQRAGHVLVQALDELDRSASLGWCKVHHYGLLLSIN